MKKSGGAINRLIAGYEVLRLGVPILGEYNSVRKRETVTISPALPGTLYRITAWGIRNIRRSKIPAVESVTTGEAS